MSDLQYWDVVADNNTTAPPDGAPEEWNPDDVNAWGREVMAAMKRHVADNNGSLVFTGSSGAYAVTTNQTVALHDGFTMCVEINETNPGACTIARNGGAAKAVNKIGGTDPLAGDLPAGWKILFRWDADNDYWQATNARDNSGTVDIVTGTGDGVTTNVTLPADPGTKNNLAVYIGTNYQRSSTYSYSGTTFTFSEAPPSGAPWEIRVTSPAPAATVGADTVGLSELASGAAGGMYYFDNDGNPANLGAGLAGQVPVSSGSSGVAWGYAAPTGVIFPYIGLTAPAGFVLASGKTIGNASSGASERANADCYALFVLLWNSWADNEAPVGGGRGASADADWAANKRIVVPDPRGCNLVGLDNIGGTAAERITSASFNGTNATKPGGRIGQESHTLTAAQLPSHTHDAGTLAFAGTTDSAPDHTHGLHGVGAIQTTHGVDATGSSAALEETEPGGSHAHTISGGFSGATAASGSGGSHSNTQPGLCLNMIIKL